MSVTMKTMELIHADNLAPDQLMVEDLIRVGEDIVEVMEIESDSLGDNYFITYKDDYGDTDTITFAYTDSIPLFVLIEEE